MSSTQKVAWMESQFLLAQHFQQQDRSIEHLFKTLYKSNQPFHSGFFTFTIDEALLEQGQLALTQATGLMPDATPFNLPVDAPLPVPLHIPASTNNGLVYLTLPIYQSGKSFIDTNGEDNTHCRYRLNTVTVYDNSQDNAPPEEVACAQLKFSLALDTQPMGGMIRLAVARIREVTPEGAIIVSTDFFPSSLNINNGERLSDYLKEIIGLVSQRSIALAHRFTETQLPGNTGGSIIDFMMLQLCNRYEPMLRHVQHQPQVHPERLFNLLVQLCGELATFTDTNKRLEHTFIYHHQDQHRTFEPLRRHLHQQLSAVLEHRATALTIETRAYGIYVAIIEDKSMLENSRFVLGIKSQTGASNLRQSAAAHLKVGSVENIRNLVNNQLSGIRATPLPIAPREIHYQNGYLYFELEPEGPYWAQVKQSAGIAFHLSGETTGLELCLWAIKS